MRHDYFSRISGGSNYGGSNSVGKDVLKDRISLVSDIYHCTFQS